MIQGNVDGILIIFWKYDDNTIILITRGNGQIGDDMSNFINYHK